MAETGNMQGTNGLRVLVAGWFSFEQMGASAGDLMARDLVCQWLGDAGIEFDIATARPFTGGVDWQQSDSHRYRSVVFVCGPFGNGPPLTEFLHHFRNISLVGLNLTMLDTLEQWNPFDLLLERDSDRTSRPDLVFLSPVQRLPVAGLILVHPQAEYGSRAMHAEVGLAIDRLIDSQDLAVVKIDTRLDENTTGLRSPGEIESLIARMDIILTTRLHGMVLALKNGVPPVVIDPIAGGAKITRQARVVGWPAVLRADQMDDQSLVNSVEFCRSAQGRQEANRVRSSAMIQLADLRDHFINGLIELANKRT